MKIRTDSWHYRLYKLTHDGFPPDTTNLCSYFWRTVVGVLVAVIMGAVILAVLALIGMVFTKFTLYSFAALGIILLLIALFIVRDRRPNRAPAEPGLVRLYLKAKKDRVCPLITFVEEENAHSSS